MPSILVYLCSWSLRWVQLCERSKTQTELTSYRPLSSSPNALVRDCPEKMTFLQKLKGGVSSSVENHCNLYGSAFRSRWLVRSCYQKFSAEMGFFNFYGLVNFGKTPCLLLQLPVCPCIYDSIISWKPRGRTACKTDLTFSQSLLHMAARRFGAK